MLTEWIKSKLSGKLLQDYIMLYFDAQIFLNSSALSLLQNIFRTRLASMSISRLICINANAFKRFWPSDAQRKVFFLKQSWISHIRMMLQLLFLEFLTTHIYLDVNPGRKLLILLPQNQVDFSSKQLSIVFPTFSILRQNF